MVQGKLKENDVNKVNQGQQGSDSWEERWFIFIYYG